MTEWQQRNSEITLQNSNFVHHKSQTGTTAFGVVFVVDHVALHQCSILLFVHQTVLDVVSFVRQTAEGQVMLLLERGYTRDWLPAYSFVVRARAMVLTGESTLSDTSEARQYCPRARQTAADNFVYGLSGVLKNRLQRTDWDAKLRHSPGMPAAEKPLPPGVNPIAVDKYIYKPVYETPNYVISHAAARWYHCTTVNCRDSSVRGYHDKTVLPCGVSPCLCSYDKTVCGQPVSSVARA
jgi:hypothetical protein